MENEEMLNKIRKDRPNQIIHKVFSFQKNKFGFYDVEVDMETMFLETKILHTRVTIPYPLSEYNKLHIIGQFHYRWNHRSH